VCGAVRSCRVWGCALVSCVGLRARVVCGAVPCLPVILDQSVLNRTGPWDGAHAVAVCAESDAHLPPTPFPTVYKTTEPVKGELPLRGAKVAVVSTLDIRKTGCPDPVALKVSSGDRELVVGFPDQPTLATWQAYLTAVAATAAPGTVAGDGGTGGSGGGAGGALTSAYAGMAPRPGVPPTAAVGYLMKAGERGREGVRA